MESIHDIRDRYAREIVKRLWICRNLYRRHKLATLGDEWDFEKITPYEKGRMTREGNRLGGYLLLLNQSPQDQKIVTWFSTYAWVTGIKPNLFEKPGNHVWTTLISKASESVEKFEINVGQAQQIFETIDAILDTPISQASNRFMLLKLSIL